MLQRRSLHNKRCSSWYDVPTNCSSKDALLNDVKKELTVNIEYYSKFINSEEVDFVDEIERYTAIREYSTATTDLVLHAVSEILECRIVIYTIIIYRDRTDLKTHLTVSIQ